MTRCTPLFAAIALGVGAAFAHAAEDRFAHQEASPQSATDEQAEHRNHAPAGDAPPPRSGQHTGHADDSGESMPQSQGGEQGQHESHAQHEQAARGEPTESERNHVPPDPPEHPMHDMSNEEMIELMQMDDTSAFSMVLLDQLEWREIDDRDALAWDGHAWYGNDYNKLRLKSEGERVAGESEGRVELYWDRIATRWWSLQAGLRRDFDEGPSRSWAAFGVQGLAPHWFEVEATAYLGEQGRVSAIFSGEYDILLTQRLILQPKLELDLYSKSDRENGIGSGLAQTELALRLRYELRREFAPYAGIVWTRLRGNTADLARAERLDSDDVQFVAGLRVWF